MALKKLPNMMPQEWGAPPVYLGSASFMQPGMMGMSPQIARPGGMNFNGPALRNVVAPQVPGAPPPTPFQPEGGGIGDKLKGVLGGIGGKIGDATDWLTDEKQGYLRQLLLSQLIGTAGSIYEANRVGNMEDEDRERKERSRKSVGPMYGQLLRELSQR